MKLSITYIISNINKALAFEWIAQSINKDKFILNFILLNPNNSELETFFKRNNIPVARITYNGKKDIPCAILQTYRILKKNKTKIVHTHLFDANIVGLTAAWLARIPKRIHTRHHSNYHHVYYPKAVKYDKLINWLSTDIVAITEVVKNILIKQERVSKEKVHLIHHGFQLNEFGKVPESKVFELNQKYNLNRKHPVVGVISRYTEWKGIQYIIPAFNQVLEQYPDALLVLANADGDYKNTIKELLKTIPVKNYIEILFEADIFALYKLFDVFVHVPISSEAEAFGQTYVEALASGIPSIFTLSGIANEFIKDHQNAMVVPYEDSDAIYDAIIEILENKTVAENFRLQGSIDVNKRFSLDKMMHSLEELYGK